jgi:hypothetical protein
MLSARRRIVVATLGVLLLGGVAGAKALPVTHQPHLDESRSDGFAVLVTVADSRIAATCENGCAWDTVTAAYPNGEYVISSAGIKPRVGPFTAVDETAFSFHLAVQQAGAGVRVRCGHGCSWEALHGAYPTGEYRITADGIEPVRIRYVSSNRQFGLFRRSPSGPNKPFQWTNPRPCFSQSASGGAAGSPLMLFVRRP